MIATHCEVRSARRPNRLLAAEADGDLVEAVRSGDDCAFEELYRRYHDRIAAYVRRMVRDPAKAEDLAQDAFFSALRRMRATDSEIAFKPWIFEIARNAAIDHWRRTSRAEEVSVEGDDNLRPSDRMRLVGSAGPDAALVQKERLDHLRGAFDELSDVHSRILVMRELEGLSYREIAEKLDLSRASVESALFRARRRLETEYADISEGRRCDAMRTVIARLSEGVNDQRDEGRLARHARRCHTCRRRARELGVEPLAPLTHLRRKVAGLLPIPFLTRRGGGAAQSASGTGGDGLSGLLPIGAHVGAALTERAAAIVVAAALAGAGGMALGGSEVLRDRPGAPPKPAVEQSAPKHRSGAREDAVTARRQAAVESRTSSSKASESATARGNADGAAVAPAAGHDEGRGGAEQSGGDTAESGGARGLSGLPIVPDQLGGGGSEGGSSQGPDLSVSPDLPSALQLSAPDGSTAAPRFEAPQSVPVDVPPPPQLSSVDTGAALDAVTATGAG